MNWAAYRLIYQAKSPVHIGWHTLGYINLTRYYIPGRTMWGAFVANLTRTYAGEGIDGYKGFGALLKTDVLTSYFYPALEPEKPLFPQYTIDGLSYGDKPAHTFERQFIRSFGQTAVLPNTNTAEDQSLHESEFIAPVIEDVDKRQRRVLFVGYLFVRMGCTVETRDGIKEVSWDGGSGVNLRTALSEVFVGGDRAYGWGRIALDGEPAKVNPGEFVHGMEFDGTGERLLVRLPPDGPIPAHLPINTDLSLKGDIEPLVSREWSEEGPGQTVRPLNNALCWMPGSILKETESHRRTFIIGPYGILIPEGGNVSESP